MVFSDYTKAWIAYLYARGNRAPTLQLLLTDEGICCSRQGVRNFINRYEETGCFNRALGSGRPSKVTADVRRLVETQMQKDDETSAYQLFRMLNEGGYNLSLQTILRCRKSLGWAFRGSAYCQLIRHAIKIKCLDFVKAIIDGELENVIYTDECTVQLETHRRFCC